ncbi:hypothetical protein [Geoalkalibacter halelectricus]|uniref:Uncharacterized protein n=1 Tax=Geoalkalibacter halelectricus TaxID=2847045 RepID=A0ABY5ZPB3_9BACT|nr:hypothetical protein [Geoalkalibacter halelectricus]MDO3380127.1 hypothetical protein [Geoalkalibacter halelectricus]UWZ80354.1 hypothetical protein L9S41_02865 [Geoalkalibacter halelectricus]
MELTEGEKKDLRTILVSIYGQEANGWNMNAGTLAATAEMLSSIKNCSQAMDYVPRPGGVIDKDYFRRQLRDMARRAANHDQIYQICRNVRAAQWRTTIILHSEKF